MIRLVSTAPQPTTCTLAGPVLNLQCHRIVIPPRDCQCLHERLCIICIQHKSRRLCHGAAHRPFCVNGRPLDTASPALCPSTRPSS